MIRGPPERKSMQRIQKENTVKIIRWSKAIPFEDGIMSNMKCMGGSLEEVRRYAEQVAKENDTNVEVIV